MTGAPNGEPILVRQLGLVPYETAWRAMQDFTLSRGPDTADEIWWLEHPPVYTLGLNGDPSHVLAPGDIPVVQSDRGGQVTYHGPGQLVVYPLIDLKRAGLGVRTLLSALENATIDLLADLGIESAARADAPGVYVHGAKIASVGLRIRRGSSYHGLALNVDLDLEPFGRINPCGMPDLPVVRLADLRAGANVAATAESFLRRLQQRLQR